VTEPRIRSLGGRLLLTFVLFLVLANVLVLVFFVGLGFWQELDLAEDPIKFLAETLQNPRVMAGMLFLQAVAGMLTILTMTRFVDRRDLDSLLLEQGSVAAVGWGGVLGLVLASVVSLFIAAVAGRHVRPELFSEAGLLWVALLGMVMLVIAFMEEWLFRGYVYEIVREHHTAGRTILLTAIAFSTLHITNPGSNFLAWINILLIGIVLGQLRELTGRLWVPFGLHLGWNLALGMVYGVPVSGLEMPSAFRISIEDLPRALGGGPFGPEASAVLTVLFVVLAILLARRLRPRDNDLDAGIG